MLNSLKDELPYYKIKCRSVAELSKKIQAVLAFIYNHVILEHASYLDQEIEDQPTDEQKRVKSFIDESYLFYEIVSKYCLDLDSYEEFELSDINIRKLMLLNPYYLCNYLIEISKRSIYGKYIEISFVVFGILMLYFAISMFF